MLEQTIPGQIYMDTEDGIIPIDTNPGINNWQSTTPIIPINPNEMVFNIDNEEISFKGKEIKRLRVMLDKFILDNYPEDLL